MNTNNSTQHLYMCKNFGLKIPNGYENNDKTLLQSIFIKTSSTRATYSSSCLSISNSLARLLNGGTGISSCHNVHHHHQHNVMAPHHCIPSQWQWQIAFLQRSSNELQVVHFLVNHFSAKLVATIQYKIKVKTQINFKNQ